MKPRVNIRAFAPFVFIVLMIISAHKGDVAYTCSFGFLALYACLHDYLHDLNVSLFNIVGILMQIGELEDEDELEEEEVDE